MGENKGLIVVITCLLFIKGESTNLCIVSRCTKTRQRESCARTSGRFVCRPRKFAKRYDGNLIERISTHKKPSNVKISCVCFFLLLSSWCSGSGLLFDGETASQWIALKFSCTDISRGWWIGAPIFIIISYVRTIYFSPFLFSFSDSFLFTQIIIDSSQIYISRQLCTISHIIWPFASRFFLSTDSNNHPLAIPNTLQKSKCVLCCVKIEPDAEQDDEKW